MADWTKINERNAKIVKGEYSSAKENPWASINANSASAMAVHNEQQRIIKVNKGVADANAAIAAIKVQEDYQNRLQQRSQGGIIDKGRAILSGVRNNLGLNESKTVLPAIEGAPPQYNEIQQQQADYEKNFADNWMGRIGNTIDTTAKEGYALGKQIVTHPIQSIETGIPAVARIAAPSLTRFAETAGGVIGEGALLGMNRIQDALTPEGQKKITPAFDEKTYPYLFKTNVKDIPKQALAAGIEATLYRFIPNTMKMSLLPRITAGGFQGAVFAIADGISQGKTIDEIKKEAKESGIAGAAIEMLLPYLAPAAKKIPIINKLFEGAEPTRQQFLRDLKIRSETIKDLEHIYGKPLTQAGKELELRNQFAKRELGAPLAGEVPIIPSNIKTSAIDEATPALDNIKQAIPTATPTNMIEAKIALENGVSEAKIIKAIQETGEVPAAFKVKQAEPVVKDVPKIPEAPTAKPLTSESPIIKRLNENLDEARKLNPELPKTNHPEQLLKAEKEIIEDPAKVYNETVHGTAPIEDSLKSSRLALLYNNARNKGDQKAMAEIITAAAEHGRRSGQEVEFLKALIEKDAASRGLSELAKIKLDSVASRFKKIKLSKGEDPVTIINKRARAVLKEKRAATITRAKSLIKSLSC